MYIHLQFNFKKIWVDLLTCVTYENICNITVTFNPDLILYLE